METTANHAANDAIGKLKSAEVSTAAIPTPIDTVLTATTTRERDAKFF